jgi:hypothetical protein
MLHENPLMVDIDVDHWRNLQTLLVTSAKTRRRIIVIHEDGEILKFVHSKREDIVRNVDRIDDPQAAAERIYRANADKVEFVVVYERDAFDQYFAGVQEGWHYGEDLDVYVHRMYAMLDDFSDGIATYPGPARSQLGLQWHIGVRYEDVEAAVQRFITPESTLVAGVFAGDALWTSLVLHFDADRRVDVVTTIDPSLIEATGRDSIIEAVIAWAEERYGRCDLAAFLTDEATARALLAASDKLTAGREALARGALIVSRVPAALAAFVPAA